VGEALHTRVGEGDPGVHKRWGVRQRARARVLAAVGAVQHLRLVLELLVCDREGVAAGAADVVLHRDGDVHAALDPNSCAAAFQRPLAGLLVRFGKDLHVAHDLVLAVTVGLQLVLPRLVQADQALDGVDLDVRRRAGGPDKRGRQAGARRALEAAALGAGHDHPAAFREGFRAGRL